MGSIKEISIRGKYILVIDYAFCKEAEMIELVDKCLGMAIEAKHPFFLMSYYYNSFITPKFLNHIEKIVIDHPNLAEKQVFVGLTIPKQIILRGTNHFLKKDFKAFDSKREAIEYLLESEVSDSEMESF